MMRLKEYYREHPECPRSLAGTPRLRRSRDDIHALRARLAGRDVGDMGNRSKGAGSGGGTVRDTHAGAWGLQLQEGGLARLQPDVPGLRGGRRLHPRKVPTGRAMPVPALAAMDASLRRARRSRVSTVRRRELKITSSGTPSWAEYPTPALSDFSRFCRRIGLKPLRRRRWRGGHRLRTTAATPSKVDVVQRAGPAPATLRRGRPDYCRFHDEGDCPAHYWLVWLIVFGP